jgi:hypothetical protein
VKHQPAYYLDGLLAHIEAIERQQRKREKKKRLSAGVEPADALLRGLEISLRTNTLECVVLNTQSASCASGVTIFCLFMYFICFIHFGPDGSTPSCTTSPPT